MKKQFTSVWIDNMAPMLTVVLEGQVDPTNHHHEFLHAGHGDRQMEPYKLVA
jgi:hypothetical protein